MLRRKIKGRDRKGDMQPHCLSKCIGRGIPLVEEMVWKSILKTDVTGIKGIRLDLLVPDSQ